VLEEKDTYTLRELIESLPLSLREFGKRYDISEVTIARLRDGKPGLRATVNRLLAALSETYDKPLTMRNVRGITFRGESREHPDQEENAA
jgi:predicted transcriptional regulator